MSVAVSVKGKYYRRKGFVELNEPAYTKDIVEPLQRYDERQTPLSRGYIVAGWQKEFVDWLEPNIGARGSLPRDEPGYTQIDLAQRIAGFSLAIAANCHTGNWTLPRMSEKLGCFYDWQGRWGPDFMGLAYKPEKMKIDDPAAMSETVKDVGLFLGASLVGITELDERWLYKPGWERYGHKTIDIDAQLPESIRYAVVMAIETNYETVKHAPTAKASAAAGLGYSKMAALSHSMAKFIGALGHTAIACGNDTALSVPLGADAGLGQLGRFGALITPEFGPRIRLCKVLTDLPLVPTKPIDFGVTEFCSLCQKCADYCPAQAILYGSRTYKARTPSTNPGLLKWPFDGERCFRYWWQNGAKNKVGMFHVDCYQCVNVCPFNKKPGPGHDLVRWLIRRKSSLLSNLMKWGDDQFYKPKYKTGRFDPARNGNRAGN